MDKQTKSIIYSAQKILPDCNYDCQFDALIPIFRVRFSGAIQVGTILSSVARFVLRSIFLEVNTLSEISKLLGLSFTDVGYGAAELRNLRLVEPHACDIPNDTLFTITPIGQRVIEENTKLFKLRKQNLQVDFNSLTGEYQVYNADGISVDDARKRGDFVEPIRKRRPRLKDIRLSDIRELVKLDGQLQDDVDLVGIVRMNDEPFVIYCPVVVVVMQHRESFEQRVLVFRGRTYLNKESQELQRMLEAGKEVIQPGITRRQDTIPSLPSSSIKEKQTIDQILRLEKETDELESTLQGHIESAESLPGASEDAKRIHDLQCQLKEKTSEIEDLKKNQALESNGRSKYVSAKEHIQLLIRALREANSSLIIVVPWLLDWTIPQSVFSEISQTLRKGVSINIVYGLGTKRGSQRELSKAKSKPAIDKLRLLAKSIPDSKLKFIEEDTHERLLFCDSKFATIGSYNWLGTPLESGCKDGSWYTERPNDIEELRKPYEDLVI